MTGRFPWIQEPEGSCNCTDPVCCVCHCRIDFYYWDFSWSVQVSYYWVYSNRKICYFVFILLTIESDFFHNFGPFIFFKILWLLMMSSLLPLSSESISPWRIFLAISFCGSFLGCHFSYYFLVVFFLILIWTLKVEDVVLYRH